MMNQPLNSSASTNHRWKHKTFIVLFALATTAPGISIAQVESAASGKGVARQPDRASGTKNKAKKQPVILKEMTNLHFTVGDMQRTAGLYVPRNYTKDKTWPLIVFLHGGGGNGDNGGDAIEWASSKLLMEVVARMEHGLEAFILIPRCPTGKVWAHVPPDVLMSPWRSKKFGTQAAKASSEDHITAAIDQVLTDFSIDQNRIAISGFSMGGEGCLRYAADHFDRFHAVAPIAGSAIAVESDVSNLARIKVWMFQGGKDNVSTPELGRKMSAWIKAAGGDVKYTEYPEASHGASNYLAVREKKYFNFLLGK